MVQGQKRAPPSAGDEGTAGEVPPDRRFSAAADFRGLPERTALSDFVAAPDGGAKDDCCDPESLITNPQG